MRRKENRFAQLCDERARRSPHAAGQQREGVIMTVPVWVTPISMAVYIVLLLLLTEFMRTHYRTSMWVWVVSLITVPLWIINIPGDDWFRWAKEDWVVEKNPIIAHAHFTATGTRFLEAEGRKAIADLYSRSFSR